MPTIFQLPATDTVSASDLIPISQDGSAHSVSIGALLAQMQPAIIVGSPSLLGRFSIGPGGPDTIAIGDGLTLNNGTLCSGSFALSSLPLQTSLASNDQIVVTNTGEAHLVGLSQIRELFTAGANIAIDAAGIISATNAASGGSDSFSLTSLSSVTTIASSDLVGVSQNGQDRTISYANLIDGLTIDLAPLAAPASDNDTFWTAQASNVMLRQTLSALWHWVSAKLQSWKRPVIELVGDTTLDGTLHNNSIMVCSSPGLISALPGNIGSGFSCDVINASSGAIIFSTNVVTSNGSNGLSPWQCGSVQCAACSIGTIVFASISGGATTVTSGSPPGAPTSITLTNITTSSITCSWTAPLVGGPGLVYAVQYRMTGQSAWTSAANSLAATTLTVTNLASASSYDFQVTASTSGGSGAPSTIVTAATAQASGLVTSIIWALVPAGSYVNGVGAIGVNAHANPATAPLQFGFSTSSTVPPTSWFAGVHVNSDLWGQYVPTPSTPGTWYGWVEGTDGSMPSAYATPFTVT